MVNQTNTCTGVWTGKPLVALILLPDASHLLAILSFQVKVVGGIHASVHALLVSGNSALHSDPLGRWSQRKLFEVVYIDGRFTDWRSRSRGHLLQEKKKSPQRPGPIMRRQIGE